MISGSLLNIDGLGAEWVDEQIDELTDHIDHINPVDFNSKHRYLSRGETPMSGLMDFSLTPYWIKPMNQLDPYDPTREIWVKKGVKTSFNTTPIEGGLLYFAAYMRAFHGGFVTADKEMAQSRMETHVIPMFQNSGFGDIFRSADVDTSNKTGKTKKLLQWLGGGSLTPEGAKNADKFRMYLWMWMWLDELDSWAQTIGKDGDPVRLVMSRAETFWNMRKIIGGSTPLLKGSSHIDRHHARGNQQIYECHCLKCGFPMHLRWRHEDMNNTEIKRGLIWEYKEGGEFYDPLSVRYECWNCGHGHQEHDKEKFINQNNADWKATATPVEEHIESYHIPALLSRFKHWSDHVATWHEAFTPKEKVKSQDNLQVFYNNVLGESFEVIGVKLSTAAAYSHRREFYHSNQILNDEIEKYCKSGVMFVAMLVDVQKHFLSVATFGVTIGGNSFLIEYKRLNDNASSEDGCLNMDSPAWHELRSMIDNEELYISDDKKTYMSAITLIDCGWGDSESVVAEFCSEWRSGVWPIKGDSQSAKRIRSFYEYQTSLKNTAYMLAVDHYKDRMAPVLRRRWIPSDGDQPRYTVNFPVNMPNSAMKELTVEYKREERKNGRIVAVWHRPNGARNELWDLLIYLQAAIEILAYRTCTINLELKETDFQEFWTAAEEEQLFYTIEE